MLKFILQCLLVLISSILVTASLGFLSYSTKFVQDYKKKSGKSKISMMEVKQIITVSRYPKLYEIVKWHLIDIIRGRDFFDLFGIWCFTGFYGEGKTMGAVQYALRLKKKYPHIHIYTNFNLKGQDGKIMSWRDLLTLPPWTIVIFDEIQGTFASTKFADFPMELLAKITKCRKTNLAVFASSPVYTRMSIQLRESTEYVIECKNMWKRKRWFRYTFYHTAEYEKYYEDKDKLVKFKLQTVGIVASDEDYDSYDTKEDVKPMEIESNQKLSRSITLDQVYKLVDIRLKEYDTKLQKKLKIS